MILLTRAVTVVQLCAFCLLVVSRGVLAITSLSQQQQQHQYPNNETLYPLSSDNKSTPPSNRRSLDSVVLRKQQRQQNDGGGISSVHPAELFYRTLSDFIVRQTNNSACRVQTDLYVAHLKNNSYWASQSKWITRGVIFTGVKVEEGAEGLGPPTFKNS